MKKISICLLLVFLTIVSISLLYPVNMKAADLPGVLGLKARQTVVNRWLKLRMERVLPELMRRERIDMWVVICREHNEEPVYLTLVPRPHKFAWRLAMLVFFDRGKDKGVERISVNPFGSGPFRKEMRELYQLADAPGLSDPWRRLAHVIRERDPKKIAVNESETFAFADGLTAFLKTRLVQSLGSEYAGRLVSAEKLAVGWLETRIPEEIEVYTQISAITHRLIREFFSRKVITPGVTTLDDLSWWTRERIAELKLDTWFQPIFYIVKSQHPDPNNRIIHRGDLLRCDVGVTYLGLNSDVQETAYVLREGETDAPQGLKQAILEGNRLQDILLEEFQVRRTGNEILTSALHKARAAGLIPKIYTHPLGYHGHAAGPRIGLPDMQEGIPGMGDYPLYYNTCYAIELSIRAVIPEWGNQEVTIALEDDAVFTPKGTFFLDERQTRLHLIK